MSDLRLAVLIILVMLIILLFVKLFYNGSKVHFIINGEHYQVAQEYADAFQAANTMAKLNDRILTFLRYLKKKYSAENAVGNMSNESPERMDVVQRILVGYNPEVLVENDPRFSKETAYTINKGTKMMFCLRDRKTLKLHDVDTLLFVALHEISHIGNKAWEHGTDFWEIFKFVLKEANESGVYTPVNYAKENIVYCGLTVTYNPYFDNSLRNI